MAVDCHISPRWFKGFLTNGWANPLQQKKPDFPPTKKDGKGVKNLRPKLAGRGFWSKWFSCPVHPDHCEGHEHQWWSSQERQYSNLRRHVQKMRQQGQKRAGRADRVLRFTLPETITRLKLKRPENRWLEEDPASFRENLGLCSEDIFIFG